MATLSAWPWIDRGGRVSVLRGVVFGVCVLPAVWLAWRWATQDLGARPLETASRDSGIWAVSFLMFTLAVTPLRQIGGWARLTQVRRMLGVTALGYTLGHLGVFAVAQGWDAARIATEVVARVPLAVGALGALGLIVLGATSFDRAIRALGPAGWRRLHAGVYALTAVALVHYLLQTKLDITGPVHFVGLFLLLMGFRAAVRLGFALGPGVLVAVTLGAAVLTALVEAGWYAGAQGAPFLGVLAANADPWSTTRPGWWVLVSGGLFLGVALAVRLWRGISARAGAA